MGKVLSIILSIFFLTFGMGCSKKENVGSPMPQEELELSGTLENGVREIEVKVSKYKFNPSSLAVNEGEKLRLVLTSTDVRHGFSLLDFGINAVIPAGGTKVVELIADKVGTFPFRCSVYCGSGHPGMQGVLMVIGK